MIKGTAEIEFVRNNVHGFHEFLDHYFVIATIVYTFWYLSVAVQKATLMRLFYFLGVTMASSYTVWRFHMWVTGSLGKCLQKVDTLLYRNIRTNVTAVGGEALRKDETGSYIKL